MHKSRSVDQSVSLPSFVEHAVRARMSMSHTILQPLSPSAKQVCVWHVRLHALTKKSTSGGENENGQLLWVGVSVVVAVWACGVSCRLSSRLVVSVFFFTYVQISNNKIKNVFLHSQLNLHVTTDARHCACVRDNMRMTKHDNTLSHGCASRVCP